MTCGGDRVGAAAGAIYGTCSRASYACRQPLAWSIAANWLAMAALSTPATADPVRLLQGKWSGHGVLHVSSGARERAKCISANAVSRGGDRFKLTVRCESENYSLDATASVDVNGSSVSGSWSENEYQQSGSLTGTVSGAEIRITLQHWAFQAAMQLTVTPCRNVVSVTPPSGYELTRIDISLAKSGCIASAQ